jgi:broad specificity phosphatase PhoE
MSRLRLLLIRHGQSEANADRRTQGRLDTPLTAAGQQEAAAVAEQIAAEGQVDALYTSPLLRAMQTASTICARIGIQPVPLPDLMELDVGAATGLSRAEAKRRWPQHLRGLRRRDLDARWPGGESIGEIAERAARVMNEITSRHPAGLVVVVSHKVLLRWALAALLSRSAPSRTDHPFDHCAIAEVVFGATEPILHPECTSAPDRAHRVTDLAEV